MIQSADWPALQDQIQFASLAMNGRVNNGSRRRQCKALESHPGDVRGIVFDGEQAALSLLIENCRLFATRALLSPQHNSSNDTKGTIIIESRAESVERPASLPGRKMDMGRECFAQTAGRPLLLMGVFVVVKLISSLHLLAELVTKDAFRRRRGRSGAQFPLLFSLVSRENVLFICRA